MPWCSARTASIGFLFGHPQTNGIEKRKHAANIVGHAELRRGDRKSGGFSCNYEIAGKYRFGGAAPDTSFDHRNYRTREILNLTHELPQRVIPAERVTS